MSEPAAEFTQWLLDRGRGPGTAAIYDADVNAFGAWWAQSNGEPWRGAFTPTDVRDYRGYLQTTARLAPGTINRKLAALRSYGGYLVALGQLTANPAAQARGIREQKLAPRWLDQHAQGRLLRELERADLAARTEPARAEALRNLALVLVLLHTGLRVAELCALLVADLTIGERGGELRVRAGKGDKGRTVPLNVTARRALAASLTFDGRRAGPVFVGRGGAALSPRGVQKVIAELGRRANVELSPHTLRHTFAKNLINQGVGLDKIAALLGHNDLTTTARYTLPGAQDLARAVAGLVAE